MSDMRELLWVVKYVAYQESSTNQCFWMPNQDNHRTEQFTTITRCQYKSENTDSLRTEMHGEQNSNTWRVLMVIS